MEENRSAASAVIAKKNGTGLDTLREEVHCKRGITEGTSGLQRKVTKEHSEERSGKRKMDNGLASWRKMEVAA